MPINISMSDYLKLKLIILFQHILALVGLVFFFSWTGIALALGMWILYYAYGMITGFHRTFSHKSFNVSRVNKLIMLTFGSLSGMGSSVGWVGQHRWHHAYSDQPGVDPYYSKGTFQSKALAWFTYPSNIHFKISVVKDLIRDKDHSFFHKHYYKILFAWVIFLAVINPWLVIYAWALPNVLTYTALTIVGVLGHNIGTQPYNNKDESRDSHILSLFTLGESYQNAHHYNPTLVVNGKFDFIGYVNRLFLK